MRWASDVVVPAQLAAVDLGLLDPIVQGLRHAANLGGY